MIKYPLTCLTNGSKLSWLMRTQELLRKEHNIMGKWYREGIILSRYQKLRAVVQINFPYYAGKLSKEEWISYTNNRFEKKSRLIVEAIGAYKNACFLSTTYSPNLDDDIKND